MKNKLVSNTEKLDRNKPRAQVKIIQSQNIPGDHIEREKIIFMNTKHEQPWLPSNGSVMMKRGFLLKGNENFITYARNAPKNMITNIRFKSIKLLPLQIPL